MDDQKNCWVLSDQVSLCAGVDFVQTARDGDPTWQPIVILRVTGTTPCDLVLWRSPALVHVVEDALRRARIEATRLLDRTVRNISQSSVAGSGRYQPSDEGEIL